MLPSYCICIFSLLTSQKFQVLHFYIHLSLLQLFIFSFSPCESRLEIHFLPWSLISLCPAVSLFFSCLFLAGCINSSVQTALRLFCDWLFCNHSFNVSHHPDHAHIKPWGYFFPIVSLAFSFFWCFLIEIAHYPFPLGLCFKIHLLGGFILHSFSKSC